MGGALLLTVGFVLGVHLARKKIKIQHTNGTVTSSERPVHVTVIPVGLPMHEEMVSHEAYCSLGNSMEYSLLGDVLHSGPYRSVSVHSESPDLSGGHETYSSLDIGQFRTITEVVNSEPPYTSLAVNNSNSQSVA